MAFSLFLIPTQTSRRTDAEKNPYQTAHQPASDKCWTYEAKFQRFEALLSRSNERDDKTNGDGTESDVQQGIRSCILLPVQTTGIFIIIRTTSSE
jgi:hypothetical protein